VDLTELAIAGQARFARHIYVNRRWMQGGQSAQATLLGNMLPFFLRWWYRWRSAPACLDGWYAGRLCCLFKQGRPWRSEVGCRGGGLPHS
jgi:hypothetical protein